MSAYSILRLSPKSLDLKVLFDLFEEKFDLPSVSVQQSDILGIEVEAVGVAGKGPLQLMRIIDDSSGFGRIAVLVVLSRKTYHLIPDDIVTSFVVVLSNSDFVFREPFLTDDKECTRE